MFIHNTQSKSKDCNRQKQCILHYFQHHNVVSCNNKIEFDVKIYTAFARNVLQNIAIKQCIVDDRSTWSLNLNIIKQKTVTTTTTTKYLNELYDFLCVDVNHF